MQFGVVARVYHSIKFGFVHIWDSTCSVGDEGIREMKSGGVVQVVYTGFLERRVIGRAGRGVNGGILRVFMIVKVVIEMRME